MNSAKDPPGDGGTGTRAENVTGIKRKSRVFSTGEGEREMQAGFSSGVGMTPRVSGSEEAANRDTMDEGIGVSQIELGGDDAKSNGGGVLLNGENAANPAPGLGLVTLQKGTSKSGDALVGPDLVNPSGAAGSEGLEGKEAEMLEGLASLNFTSSSSAVRSGIQIRQQEWTEAAVREVWTAAGIPEARIRLGVELAAMLDLDRSDLAFTLIKPLLVGEEATLQLMLTDPTMLFAKLGEESVDDFHALLQGDLATMLAHAKTRVAVGRLLRENLETNELIQLMDSPDDLYAEVSNVVRALVSDGSWEVASAPPSGRTAMEIEQANLQDVADAIGEENEDSDDPYIWASEHIDKAFACEVQAPKAAIPGFVLSRNGGFLKILHGDNKTVDVKAPLLGHYSKAAAGSGVLLCRSTLVNRNGTATDAYSLVLGEDSGSCADPRQLPRLRAYVKSYSTNVKGLSEGVAVVTATGTQLRFSATRVMNSNTLPINSTFLFHPTFVSSDQDLMVPSVVDIDSVSVEQLSCTKARLLKSDLVSGFYAPETRLQTFLSESLGVNALPYVGGKGSSLALSGGDEFIRRLTARKGVKDHDEHGPYACSMLDLSERMAKAKVFADSPNATKEDLLANMVTDITHLVIPTAREVNSYADYLETQLTKAETRGYRLRVVVGVLIDECATVTSLYNTEDCVFFKNNKFPWVQSFNILDGSYMLLHFNSDLDDLAPAVDDTAGKKLLLVELDSSFRAEGTLPAPGCLRTPVSGAAPVALSAPAPGPGAVPHEVLVGLPTIDPRVTALLRDCGQAASIYRKWGRTTILALSFASQDAAEDFILQARQEKSYFCMSKANLHDPNTLTLACFQDSSPDELYTMLDAVEVLPVGRNSFRFTSTHSMLSLAKVLWKHDSYKRMAKSKHYRILRDDHNNYVLLGQKSPTRVLRYHRRLPMPTRRFTNEESKAVEHWYCISMLPRGFSDERLRERIRTWEELPNIVTWKIDRTSYRPRMWVAAEERVLLEPVKTDLFDDPIVFLPSARPPRQACDLGQGGENGQVGEVLAKGAWKTHFTPTKAVEKMLESLPQPAEDPRSVLRRADRRTQRPSGSEEKEAKQKAKHDKAKKKAVKNKESRREDLPVAGEDSKAGERADRMEMKQAGGELGHERPAVADSGKDQKIPRRPRGQPKQKVRKISKTSTRAQGTRPITDWAVVIQSKNQTAARVDVDSSASAGMGEMSIDSPTRGGKRPSSSSGFATPRKAKANRPNRRIPRPSPYGPRGLPDNARTTDVIAPQQSASHEYFVHALKQ